MTPADPSVLASLVARILDKAGLRYVIGGSVAASIYGEPRSTLDLDIMIEADEQSVRALVIQLAGEFHVDEQAAVDAVRQRGTFNAIHLASAMKVDFFIAEDDARTREQLDRRRAVDAGGQRLLFYAPEDIVIRKLLWFRMGGEQSERQWRDVIGILRLSGRSMDRAYLKRSAAEFAVDDLLKRAVAEIG